MSVKVLYESNTDITVLYNEELSFKFEILNDGVRFKRADFVVEYDSGYRAGGNSERTYKYKMPHYNGDEENIPIEVIDELKKRGYLEKEYPN